MPAIGIRVGGHAKLYPFSLLADNGLLNDSIGTTKVLITYDPDFSTAAAFERELVGAKLNFRPLMDRKDGLLLMDDADTGSSIAGLLDGQSLKEIDSVLSTGFDWEKLYPNTEVYS